jgi:sulfonate transport system substrate-binding protein
MTAQHALGRRSFLAVTGGSALALAGCASQSGKTTTVTTGALPTGAPPPHTRLNVAVHTTQIQLKARGKIDKLPFTVPTWPNVSAGPDVIQGFRAGSVDLATNAGIPPIQAHSIGVEAKIVAVQTRNIPIYTFATRPGSDIAAIKDFRGKKIAFSQGQAQGVVVLRALKEAGLTTKDVNLVPLPSTQFLTALQAKQVDVAPLGEPTLTLYLKQYGKDGARGVHTDVVDLLTVLWTPTSVLKDKAKTEAIRSFIPIWAQGNVWAYENPKQWIQAYYVKDQGVTTADGERIVTSLGKPYYPASWDKAIAWEQETADLLAKGGYDHTLKAEDLFDRRFEHIAARSVPREYRG